MENSINLKITCYMYQPIFPIIYIKIVHVTRIIILTSHIHLMQTLCDQLFKKKNVYNK